MSSSVLPILFEDHTAANFRPLSWSVPVYELRCGLFNLRERVARLMAVAAADSRPATIDELGRPVDGGVHGSEGPVLLPRLLLKELPGPIGPVGTDQLLPTLDHTALLLINGRVAQRWDLLRVLLRFAEEGTQFAWFDADGLLACTMAGEEARALVEDWERWNWQTETSGCWRDTAQRPEIWSPEPMFSGWREAKLEAEYRLLTGENAAPQEEIAARLKAVATACRPRAYSYLWDLVPDVGTAICDDVTEVVAPGRSVVRELFGIATDETIWRSAPPWAGISRFQRASELGESSVAPGAVVDGAENLWLAQDVRVAPGAVLDAALGPLVIDRTVTVMPHAYLQGPLYVGTGSTIKAGARIYGETSIGAMCKVAGEVAESTLLDFGNKQHDGFIGHAYLGSWINLGAGTTCSDLKNNYGTVRVDQGFGPVDTGSRFVGLMMSEHAKSAIGTLFNTGSCVGFSSNVFGAGFPAKYLPNFSWGDGSPPAVYDAERAASSATVVMGRRGVQFTAAHGNLFTALARQS